MKCNKINDTENRVSVLFSFVINKKLIANKYHLIIIIYSYHIIGFLINMQRATSTSVGPLPNSWLAARMADLTQDLQVRLSWALISESFHSLQSLPVSCFHVILGLPGPRFPSTCMSKAVLTAPLERSTCPYHRYLLQNAVQILNAKSLIGSGGDNFLGPDIADLSDHCPVISCRRWRFGFVNV